MEPTTIYTTERLQHAAQALLRLALIEDSGQGDLTTTTLLTVLGTANNTHAGINIQPSTPATAVLIADAELVFCGEFWVRETFEFLPTLLEPKPLTSQQPNATFTFFKREGERVGKGEQIATLHSDIASLLRYERIALNGIQHLSGIATTTERYVAALKDTQTVISDTRKTLPGYRLLEKYAVFVGGATNHRFSLSDAFLIKDNHIALAGGNIQTLAPLIAQRRKTPKLAAVPLTIECASLTELAAALTLALAPTDFVMLDNFNHYELTQALKMIKKRVRVEISGNIRFEDLKRLRSLNFYIDRISVGALTHSVQAADISMDINF